jgi:hypothetical protein
MADAQVVGCASRARMCPGLNLHLCTRAAVSPLICYAMLYYTTHGAAAAASASLESRARVTVCHCRAHAACMCTLSTPNSTGPRVSWLTPSAPLQAAARCWLRVNEGCASVHAATLCVECVAVASGPRAEQGRQGHVVFAQLYVKNFQKQYRGHGEPSSRAERGAAERHGKL